MNALHVFIAKVLPRRVSGSVLQTVNDAIFACKEKREEIGFP